METTRPWWLPREPRRMKHGDEPGLTMQFHDDDRHSIFETPKGYDVVLYPGMNLGTYATLVEAQDVAEDNARTRALNKLERAQQDIARAALVLGNLSRKTP